ncbi:hypothetical protein D3C71_1889350 [compost metagenome]
MFAVRITKIVDVFTIYKIGLAIYFHGELAILTFHFELAFATGNIYSLFGDNFCSICFLGSGLGIY